mgnify:CR=1 FL=1
MKILIYGSGVIGTSYAWLLSEAGFDISLLVRKIRYVRYSHSGVMVNCTDLRAKGEGFDQTVFRPKTVDKLEPSAAYDLIIVAVRHTQLNDVIPHLSKFSGNAHLLFMGHSYEALPLISKHLPKGRYLFGFPEIIGGGQTDNGISVVIFDKGHTWLGEPDGKTSARLKEVMRIFKEAGLSPAVHRNILGFLQLHSVWPVVLAGAATKASGMRQLSGNTRLIKQLRGAAREGMQLRKTRGVSVLMDHPWCMVSLPGFLSVWMIRRWARRREVQEAWEGFFRHCGDEITKQFRDIRKEGQEKSKPMPYWLSLEKHLETRFGVAPAERKA